MADDAAALTSALEAATGGGASSDLPMLSSLRRHVTEKESVKEHEAAIQETMSSIPELRRLRRLDLYRVFKLLSENDNARERRQKVFDYFNAHVSRESGFQTGEIHHSAHELLVLVDEFRELLDRLFSWCDLCLPANEQAFAESHRQKIQRFQTQLVGEMKRSNAARAQVTVLLEARVDTLRHLLSSKDVQPQNLGAWEKAHNDMLTLQESNSYLLMGRLWEQILESYLLLFNYWKVNLKDDSFVFGDDGKSSDNSYFA